MEKCKGYVLLECWLEIATEGMCHNFTCGFVCNLRGVIDAGFIFIEKIVCPKTSYGTL
jgi:hypothetical protein